MTGPEHFREGEERMRASDYQRAQAGDDGDLTTALHEAAMARNHFLAALVALHAEDKHPESVSWQRAVGW
ncbi:hypothetical protein ACWD25_43430 [Streptomyces sp. NPDC002920]